MEQNGRPEKNRGVLKGIWIGAILVVCYVAHWFPFNFIAAARHLPWQASLGLIGSIVLARILIGRLFPKAKLWTGRAYYLLVTIYAILIGYYILLLDPLFFLLGLLVLAALAAVLIFCGECKLALIPFLLLLAAYLYGVPHGFFRFAGLAALLVLMPGFLLATPRQIGRAALFFAALVALITLRLGYFYFGGDPNLVGKVTNQPGIEAVLTIDRDLRTLRKAGRQVRYAADNMAGSHLLVGGDSATILLSDDGKNPQQLLPGSSTDGVVYDPAGGAIVTGDLGRSQIVVIDDASMKVVATAVQAGRAFTNLRIDRAGARVLTGDDLTTDIGVFSLKDRSFERIVKTKASRDALFDPKSGLFIATTLRRVRWIDPESGEVVRQLKVPASQVRLACDPGRRLLYVSLFSIGELWRVNLDSLAVEKTLKLEPGIRFLRLTEDQTTLFASSYFKGNIFHIRVPEMVVEKTIYAGPRVRTLHIAPGSNRLVFGSSLGVFRYNK